MPARRTFKIVVWLPFPHLGQRKFSPWTEEEKERWGHRKTIWEISSGEMGGEPKNSAWELVDV